MLAFVLAAALGAAEVTPAQTVTVRPPELLPECPGRIRRYTNSVEDVQARRLGELPPAVLMHTVDKKIDGCSVNVLVRRDASGRKMEIPAGTASARPLPARRPGRR